MKPNVLPFLLLPGVCMFGALAGGWSGVEWALWVWFAAVAFGTAIAVGWHLIERLAGHHRSARPAPSRTVPSEFAN